MPAMVCRKPIQKDTNSSLILHAPSFTLPARRNHTISTHWAPVSKKGVYRQ